MEKIKEEYLALISSIKWSIELWKTEKDIKLVDIIKKVCEDYKKLGELDREWHLSVKDDLIAREVWWINAWFAAVAVNGNKIIKNEQKHLKDD